ncbi:MAG TPA: aldolase/citrate lyase family protein [Acidimicrobiales bacterium]|nr:aldolase/citrate lyase family protein [Acidimicrobiales bacterium]
MKLIESDEVTRPRWMVHGTSADADVIEMCAVAGADAYIIDLEHGSATVKECANAVRAADAFGLTTLVRVTSQELMTASRLLDAGAAGIVVADVRGPGDSKIARDTVFHPPLGRRGFGGSRDNSYGAAPMSGRGKTALEPLLGVQIESAEGLSNLDAIFSEPGVQFAMAGTRDLAVDLGHGADLQHPQVLRAVEKVAASALQHDVGFAIMVRSPEQVTPAMLMQPTWLLLPFAALVRTGFDAYVRAVAT